MRNWCGRRGGHGRASRRGPGCGTRGRRRGLVAVPVGGGRARAGLEIDHSEPSGSRVAISRAGRRPRAHKAARPTSGVTSNPRTPRRHTKTARPHWGRAAVAVALGFEPRVAVTPHSISSAAPSAARTRYLTRILYYTLPLRAQIDRAGWEQGHTAAYKQGHTTAQDHTTAHETDAT